MGSSVAYDFILPFLSLIFDEGFSSTNHGAGIELRITFFLTEEPRRSARLSKSSDLDPEANEPLLGYTSEA